MSDIPTFPSELLSSHDWDFPVPIAYGPGRLSEIGVRCSKLDIHNPLIVTDRGSKNLPFISQLESYLTGAGLQHSVFSEISPNPLDEEVYVGRNAFRSGTHDAVIAIGGGSAMDGGKSIGLLAHNDLNIWDYEYEQPSPETQGDSPFPKLITIPTTAGTGAETESTAMITHVAKGMKFCVWHKDFKPSLALLDPELTLDLPPTLTAWTGADALTHAIEAYLVPGFHPLCDAIAVEGLRLIYQWLPVVNSEPQNLEARGAMLVGSCLAGISFLKGLGMVHAISHMIGAEYNTQHGLTNAIILPAVLRFNLQGMDEKVLRMEQAMQLDDQSTSGLILAIENLLDELAIPTALSEIGVPVDCVERIAEKALLDSAAGTNPRSVSLQQAKELVVKAIENAR